MPVETHVHCQATVDSNTVMVFGGCTEGNCQLDTALRLGLAKNKWKKLPSLPTGCIGPSCGVVRERGQPRRFIITGGWRRRRILLNTVEILELSNLKRVAGFHLAQPIYLHVSVPYRNAFYIVGGRHGRHPLNTVYRYDPLSATGPSCPTGCRLPPFDPPPSSSIEARSKAASDQTNNGEGNFYGRQIAK